MPRLIGVVGVGRDCGRSDSREPTGCCTKRAIWSQPIRPSANAGRKLLLTHHFGDEVLIALPSQVHLFGPLWSGRAALGSALESQQNRHAKKTFAWLSILVVPDRLVCGDSKKSKES